MFQLCNTFSASWRHPGKTMQFLSVSGAGSSLYRRNSSRLRRLCKSIKSSRGSGGDGLNDGGGGSGGGKSKRSPYADLISADHARKIQVCGAGLHQRPLRAKKLRHYQTVA